MTWRSLWRDRKATTLSVHTQVARECYEMPRTYSMATSDLRERLMAARSPLRWRVADLRWCWQNAVRALRGLPMLSVPYEENIEFAKETSARSFEMDTYDMTMTRRRRIRGAR